MMEQRERSSARRASQVDELEESRRRHDDFRASIFSTSNRALDRPPEPQQAGYPVSAVAPALTGGGNAGESRIDAAIRAAMAKDSERGAQGFSRIPLTTNISNSGSAFQQSPLAGGNANNYGVTNNHNHPLVLPRPAPQPSHQYQHPALGVGGGSGGLPGGASPMITPSSSMERMSRERERTEGYRKHYASGGGGSGSGNGMGGGSLQQYGTGTYVSGNRVTPIDDSISTGTGSASRIDADLSASSGTGGAVFVYGQRKDMDMERSGGSSSQSGGGTRSTWGQEDGVDSGRAVGGTYVTSWPMEQPVPAPLGGGGGARQSGGGGGGPTGDSGRGQMSDSSSSRSGGNVNREAAEQKIGQRPHGSSQGVPSLGFQDDHDEILDPGEVSLTPAGDEEPLELPGGVQHITLSKFLEVMTGPGLRVRKHHRAGKGSSGLRVLRYSEEEDSLVWDSHKILGAAQHVLPMSDVEHIAMQPGNRVVLTCVGGRDSFAVFEAAKDDAAAVLFVGLERLRDRSATDN